MRLPCLLVAAATLLLTARTAVAGQCDTPANLVPHAESLVVTNAFVSIVQEFGTFAAAAGDVDGDGVPDLLGYAELFPGMLQPSVPVVVVYSGTDGAPIFARGLDGDTFTSFLFGSQVAAAGDVTGDGFDDVLAGSPGSGEVLLLAGPDGRLIRSLRVGAAADGFGFSVANAGDVTGDGVPDQVIGAPQALSGRTGYARVYSGADGTLVHHWDGPGLGARFGHAVDGAGDVDGDGVPDLVIGAPGDGNVVFDPGNPPFVPAFRTVDGAGSVSVYSGRTGELLGRAFGDAVPGQIDNPQALGSAVCGAGDLDADGRADVAAATFPEAGSPSSAFYTRTLRLDDDGVLQPLATLVVPGARYVPAAAGDLDGDGHDDLLIGSTGPVVPSNAGGIYALSGADGSQLFSEVCLSPSSGIVSRVSVDGLGDADGDGVPDFLAGASDNIFTGGALRVYTSGAGGP